jgi:hypothetical protein
MDLKLKRVTTNDELANLLYSGMLMYMYWSCAQMDVIGQPFWKRCGLPAASAGLQRQAIFKRLKKQAKQVYDTLWQYLKQKTSPTPTKPEHNLNVQQIKKITITTQVAQSNTYYIDGDPFFMHGSQLEKEHYLPIGVGFGGKALFPYFTQPPFLQPWNCHGLLGNVDLSLSDLPEYWKQNKLSQQQPTSFESYPCIVITRNAAKGDPLHVLRADTQDTLILQNPQKHLFLVNNTYARMLPGLDQAIQMFTKNMCLQVFINNNVFYPAKKDTTSSESKNLKTLLVQLQLES